MAARLSRRSTSIAGTSRNADNGPAHLDPIGLDRSEMGPSQLSMAETYLTVAEVAELLRLNPQTVRNWIDKAALPAVRLGARRVRIKQSDLDRFIEAGETAAPGTEPEPADEAPNEPELRERLGAALDATRSALADGDDPELVAALNEMAKAASGLGQALTGAARRRARP